MNELMQQTLAGGTAGSRIWPMRQCSSPSSPPESGHRDRARVRLGQDSQRIHKLMRLAVTSPVVPIYSGDKQRANHRSELAIPAARSSGGLRCRWSITATS